MDSTSKHALLEKSQSSNTCTTISSSDKTLVSYLPMPLVPYAELLRLNEPAYDIVISHIASGALLAATLEGVPAHDLFKKLVILLVASMPVRCINLTWNDIADADFDRRVSRTRNRPIARGAISMFNIWALTAFLALTILAELWFAPAAFSVHAVPNSLLTFIYPLSKRFTDYPQVIFGFLVAPAVILGSAALGITPFVSQQCKTLSHDLLNCFDQELCSHDWPVITLCAAHMVWGTFCETVCSFADIRDDARVGVRTITLRIQRHAKLVLSLMAALMVALLVLTGLQARFSAIYYASTVGGSAVASIVLIRQVDLEDPCSCVWWFIEGTKTLGGPIVLRVVAEYFRKILF